MTFTKVRQALQHAGVDNFKSHRQQPATFYKPRATSRLGLLRRRSAVFQQALALYTQSFNTAPDATTQRPTITATALGFSFRQGLSRRGRQDAKQLLDCLPNGNVMRRLNYVVAIDVPLNVSAVAVVLVRSRC